MLIDPACANASEEDKLKSIVAEHQLIIRYILLRTHIDHIAGAEFAKNISRSPTLNAQRC